MDLERETLVLRGATRIGFEVTVVERGRERLWETPVQVLDEHGRGDVTDGCGGRRRTRQRTRVVGDA